MGEEAGRQADRQIVKIVFIVSFQKTGAEAEKTVIRNAQK